MSILAILKTIWSKIMTSLAAGIVSARDFLRDAHEELIAAFTSMPEHVAALVEKIKTDTRAESATEIDALKAQVAAQEEELAGLRAELGTPEEIAAAEEATRDVVEIGKGILAKADLLTYEIDKAAGDPDAGKWPVSDVGDPQP